MLLDVLNARQCAKELECMESRFQGEDRPAFEMLAKDAAREASELNKMISTLIALRNQQPNEPFTIAVPEIIPYHL